MLPYTTELPLGDPNSWVIWTTPPHSLDDLTTLLCITTQYTKLFFRFPANDSPSCFIL